MLKYYVEVRVPMRFEHRWKNAPVSRSYLRHFHPHNFEVRVEMQVFKSDREIEFHSLQDFIAEYLLTMVDDFHEDSCETIARKVLFALQRRFGKEREIQVEVWEDESCGGKVKYSRA